MPKNETSSRNSLIIKIALFLNYLNKDNHPKLIRDLQSFQKNNKNVDVLKIMLANKYVTRRDITALKKIRSEERRVGKEC